MSATIIGDAFVDVIVPIQHMRPGETYHRSINISCGGTANTAVGITNFGENAKFVGKIGKDVFGEYFKNDLKINKVTDLTIMDDNRSTGLCISMTYDNGERTMIANRGANDYLIKDELESRLDEICSSEIVLFSGYSLLSRINVESILFVVNECINNDCKIYFNPGASNIISDQFKETINNLVDVLILNIDEAKAITGEDNLKEIIDSLSNLGCEVVMTMNDAGCILTNKDDSFHIKTQKLRVEDTTGAGDAFTAGYILGNLKGYSELDCARWGNEIATKFLLNKGGVVAK